MFLLSPCDDAVVLFVVNRGALYAHVVAAARFGVVVVVVPTESSVVTDVVYSRDLKNHEKRRYFGI